MDESKILNESSKLFSCLPVDPYSDETLKITCLPEFQILNAGNKLDPGLMVGLIALCVVRSKVPADRVLEILAAEMLRAEETRRRHSSGIEIIENQFVDHDGLLQKVTIKVAGCRLFADIYGTEFRVYETGDPKYPWTTNLDKALPEQRCR